MDDLEFAEAWANGETLPDENLDDRWLSVCRSLIAAHERIKEMEAKQQWQPIETAPKGEMFIYYQERVGKRCVGLAYLARDGSWRDSETDHHKQINPTKWMPLPEPPK